MINIKDNLDNRICDIEKGTINTQTYREYMDFMMCDLYGRNFYDLDRMSNLDLNKLLEFLDEKATK